MKQQWLFKVIKVLGILQFLLGVAVICADVLAYYHTNLPIFAGVSTSFAFLGSGALAVASSIYISYLLMVSSLFASFISSVSAIIQEHIVVVCHRYSREVPSIYKHKHLIILFSRRA